MTSSSHYSVFWFCLWWFLACTCNVKKLILSCMTLVFSIIVRRDLPPVLRIKTKKNFPMFFSSSFFGDKSFQWLVIPTVPWQNPIMNKSKFLCGKKNILWENQESQLTLLKNMRNMYLKCWNQLVYHKTCCWPWCNFSLSIVCYRHMSYDRSRDNLIKKGWRN